MTRIVLHAAAVPPAPGPRMMLAPPWRWWETVVRKRSDGALIDITICADADGQPETYTATFGNDWDRIVLNDPPSLLIDISAEYPASRYCSLHDAVRHCEPVQTARIRVVWHERPGEHWRQPSWHMASTRANTCSPGEYTHTNESFQAGDRRRIDDGDDYGLTHTLARLEWPLRPTEIDGHAVTVTDLSELGAQDRCRQCQRFMQHDELVRAYRRWSGHYRLCDECHRTAPGNDEDPIPYPVPTWDEMSAAQRMAILTAPPRSAPHERYARQSTRWRADERDGQVMTVNEMRVRAGLSPVYTPDWLQRPAADSRRNPEQNVLDDIEALVNDELAHEPSGYDNNINQDRCGLCGGNWHGLTGDGAAHVVVEGTDGAESYVTRRNGGARGCPGAFATDDEITEWRATHS